MAKVNCLVVLGFADGSFEAISCPNKLLGYRPNDVWFFGEPQTEKEKELLRLSMMISSGCGFPLNRID